MQEPLPMTIEGSAPKPVPSPPWRPSRGEWRIDAHTRCLGLQGVALARAALEASQSRESQPDAA